MREKPLARDAKAALQPMAEAAARSAGHAAASAHVVTHAPHAASYALKATINPDKEKAWQALSLSRKIKFPDENAST